MGGSLLWKKARHQAYQQQLTRLEQLQTNYQQTVSDAHLIQTHRRQYRKLKQKGFIGPEQRLQWVTAVRNSAASQGLYQVTYRMQQQQAYLTSEEISPFILYSSRMNLHLELAHEGQLLNFFSRLQKTHRGIYNLDHCVLNPVYGEEGIKRHKANIVADCQLYWYTIRDRMTKQRDSEDGL